jgi:shikimate kinase/3-dehydroquinate synthase
VDALSAASGDRGRAIVFIGFMGAGKSTAARRLADASGERAVDVDALLEERFGHPVAHEFAARGEASFRAAEEAQACAVLERAGAGDWVSLGGGAVQSERVRRALQPHVTVLLEVPVAEAWRRCDAGRVERPLARDPQAFAALFAQRAPLYESLADAIVTSRADRRIPAALADPLRRLAAAPDRARMLWAWTPSTADGGYPVYVGAGLLATPPWPAAARPPSRRFCVSDETVARLHGAAVGSVQGLRAIPPGEEQKTLATAEGVWRWLAGEGMTRGDHLVALGGGVVGDLAGFCAATYQRGVPIVQLPTTLVAQVDSALGGKTGVDLPEAKNYVGAYHQPAAVIADPAVLATLPAAEHAAGYAEVVKTALIAGGALWERVAAGGEVDDAMILACARTKLAVVGEDERDAGRRQVLNLGHTVGHAIEAATGYRRYRHGEAVALGLLAALRLSEQPALREDVRELLARRGLPTQLAADVDDDAVLAALARDKKRVGARVPFVLVAAPGEVRHGAAVDGGAVRAAVRELFASG